MKKRIIVIIVLIFAIVFLCGCEITFGQSSNSDGSNTHSDIQNYGGSMALDAYNVVEKKNEPELYGVAQFEDKVYFSYYLGLVKRTPVYTSLIWQCTPQEYEINFQFDSLTSESLERDLTTARKKTVSLGSSASIGYEIGAKVNFGGVEFTGKESYSTELSAEYNDEHSVSETIKDGYVKQYKEGYSFKLVPSKNKGFREGYYYRLSFYEAVKCYAILIYNTQTKTYTYTFDNVVLEKQRMVVLEESENGDFDYKVNPTINFDMEKAIEIAQNNLPSIDDVIYIRSVEEFVRYMNENTEGKSFKITCSSLDLKQMTVSPFKEFKGTLDGGNCEISGWKQKYLNTGDLGLFKVNSGTIKNLTIESFKIYQENPDINGESRVGLLCGTNNGVIDNVSVKNCNVDIDLGDINAGALNYAYLGAVCGLNKGTICGNGEICENILHASVFTQYENANGYVGGVAGYSISGEIRDVNSHHNTLSSKCCANADKNWFGCWNHGRPYAYVGGIVGVASNTSLSNLKYDQNNMKAEYVRDCNCDTNKGKNTGLIQGQ